MEFKHPCKVTAQIFTRLHQQNLFKLQNLFFNNSFHVFISCSSKSKNSNPFKIAYAIYFKFFVTANLKEFFLDNNVSN